MTDFVKNRVVVFTQTYANNRKELFHYHNGDTVDDKKYQYQRRNFQFSFRKNTTRISVAIWSRVRCKQ